MKERIVIDRSVTHESHALANAKLCANNARWHRKHGQYRRAGQMSIAAGLWMRYAHELARE